MINKWYLQITFKKDGFCIHLKRLNGYLTRLLHFLFDYLLIDESPLRTAGTVRTIIVSTYSSPI